MHQTLVKNKEDFFQDYLKRDQVLEQGREIELKSKNSKGSREFMATKQGKGEGIMEWKLTNRNLIRYQGCGDEEFDCLFKGGGILNKLIEQDSHLNWAQQAKE